MSSVRLLGPLFMGPLGLQPRDAIVTVSDEEGGALVGARQAVWWVPPAGQDVPQLAGGQAALALNQAAQRNVATMSKFSRLQTVVNGADHTTHAQFTLECLVDRMRLGVLNGTGADWAGCKAMIGKLAQTGNKAGATVNAGAWVNCTYGGASSFTALGVGGSNDDPLVTWSDWMTGVHSIDRTDGTGSLLPVHSVRIEVPAAVANRTGYFDTGTLGWNDETLGSAPYGRILRMRKQAVLAATSAAAGSFTTTTNVTDGIPFLVQYVPRLRDCATIMLLGNSINEGAGATVQNFGWAHELQAMLSTPQRPVEICNLAVGGAASAVDEARALRLLRDIMPTVLVVSAFNINDTGAGSTILATEIDVMRLRWAGVRAEAARLGIPVLTLTGIPGSTATWPWGATDALRRALNEELLTFGALSRQPVVDVARPLEGADDGTGMLQLRADLTGDNTHPNTPGYQVIARTVAPYIRALMA